MQIISAALAGCCVICCLAQGGPGVRGAGVRGPGRDGPGVHEPSVREPGSPTVMRGLRDPGGPGAPVGHKGAQVRFIKHVLTKEFISEGVAIADVNRDGKPDIVAGAYWFEAPLWTRHALAPPKHYDPSTQFSNSFLDFSLDVNQDGWPDLVRISLPGEEAVWYENPRIRATKGPDTVAVAGAGGDASSGGGADNGVGTGRAADGEDGHGAGTRYWRMHPLLNNAGNESPAMVDVNGDGRPDLLCNDPAAKEMIWLQPPTKKGDTVWTRHVIAKGDIGTGRYTHGLGLIDMNGDGRKDVVITRGWWECPADPTTENWTFHPAGLGEDCSQIYALDVKGNGRQELVSASAHRYGIWWHEHTDTGWVHHLIFDKVSETHAMALADVNGDGHPDLVTGKRYYAHNGEDPGAHEPALLYWFEFHPGKHPEWIPHLIDDDSGVGLQVLVQDLNGDGLKDIIVSNKKGVFFFEAAKE